MYENEKYNVHVCSRELFSFIHRALQSFSSKWLSSRFLLPKNIITMNDDVHIGQLIYNVLTEDGRTASWLAKKLHYDKSNIYRIF